MFLPQRVLLTGFIRVCTTSLTSQRAEKLQYPPTGGGRLPGNRGGKNGGEIFLRFPESLQTVKMLFVHICSCCSSSISICHQSNHSVRRRTLTTWSKLARVFCLPLLIYFKKKKSLLPRCCWRPKTETEEEE